MSEDLIGALVFWSTVSFFSVCVMAIGGELSGIENKPTHWMLFLFLSPGILILVIIIAFFTAVSWPFRKLDAIWKRWRD